ncbi:phBC6A51 family helix-turn-helix protein [Paenibacillus sp. FSL K6-1566]|uniref:phBC6A51 family helix-turn-helix protein n=1 Tax=Paenibacillus TaxID=44249 RepID=UPI00203A4A57|nr:phBC6A51 family helix-turn-helix protein [Paenibacillus lactis]MCM3497656.1 phBC6A51 family helix-turn-helix protein [Paenibacillus lactis]
MAKRRKKRARPPLDDRHRLAIELLTAVPSQNLEDIAQACGVNRRTLFRWRLRKDFERELRKVQQRKADEYRRRMKRKFNARITDARDLEEVFRVMDLIP